MIDWNAIATPPKEGSRAVHNAYRSMIDVRTKRNHDFHAAEMDRLDREYFGSHAEQVARTAQYDLFRSGK